MTLARWRDDVLDWALAVTIAAGAMLQQRSCDCRQDPLWLNAVLILLGTLPLGLRRRQPFAVFTVVGLASLVHVLGGFANQFLNTFAVMVAVFSVADYAPWPLSVLAGAAVALALPVNFAADWTNQRRVSLSDIPYNYALFGAAWVLGDNLRQRRQREGELVERAERLLAEQDERAHRAVADERARIARDLHDVVAHTVSVIVLHAGAARRIAAEQPERARGALEAIEALGREAAADMRRLVGILRAPAEPAADTEPQPSLARLDTLVDRVRAAGLDVRLHIEGEARTLAPGVDLSAYRIVQEALTNTLRHAHAERAEVVLRYRADGLELEVSDNGRGSVPAAGGGQGLIGMRERAAIFGGRVEAGPGPGAGFRVRVLLPLEGSSA
ncbi:MAG TPA: sensor histidine kinase [Candidatus Dormibacteraeota bacterium]|nr:sensor histidine kinase [Candidatus Dormibacteraeota bacterium]